MSINLIRSDITQLKCEIIVNSLGINTNRYGLICKNIVKKANSTDLVNKIDSFSYKNEYGKIFVTDGYNLPCKNIIHITTPKVIDDEEYIELRDCYIRVLFLALKKGYKSIALPIMGTGANGYVTSYVEELVTKIANIFSSLHPELEITVCFSPYKPQIKRMDNEESRNLELYVKRFFDKGIKYVADLDFESSYFEDFEDYSIDELLDNKSKMLTKELCNISLLNKNNFDYDAEQLLSSTRMHIEFDMNSLPIKSVTDYINKYISLKFPDENENKIVTKYMRKYVGGETMSSLQTKHSSPEKRTTMTIPMLMRYILSLRMDMKESEDLLLFCGRAFSPASDEDKVYKTFINQKGYMIMLLKKCQMI